MHHIYFLEEYTNYQIHFFFFFFEPVKHVNQGNHHSTAASFSLHLLLKYFHIFSTDKTSKLIKSH